MITDIDYMNDLAFAYHKYPSEDRAEKICKLCFSIVACIARRHKCATLELEDLENVGRLAVYESLRNYNPTEREIKFNTYVTHIIAGRIRNYIRDFDRIMRIPTWCNDSLPQLRRLKESYFRQHGNYPSVQYCAEKLNKTIDAIETLNKLLARPSGPRSLNAIKDYAELFTTISEYDNRGEYFEPLRLLESGCSVWELSNKLDMPYENARVLLNKFKEETCA